MTTPIVIDISHYDGIKSFGDLHAAGIQRVIHKATEGVTEVDGAYATRLPQALAAGLAWEAYHFWRPDDPKAQATNFLNVADGASAYWLDYEVSGGTPGTLMSLMDLVNEGTGTVMGLYTTRSLAEHLAMNSTTEQAEFFAKCPLWLADPGVESPTLETHSGLMWPKISLWQYTWSGQIAGVSGNCDLNTVPGAA